MTGQESRRWTVLFTHRPSLHFIASCLFSGTGIAEHRFHKLRCVGHSLVDSAHKPVYGEIVTLVAVADTTMFVRRDTRTATFAVQPTDVESV